jgi:hypothetical protein
MINERLQDIPEEIAEVQSLSELKALWCFGQSNNNEYGDAVCVPHFKAAVARLRNTEEVPMDEVAELEAQIAALKAKLASPKVQAKPPVQPVVRGLKKYRLLSDDVSWSTKPQVHSVMAILRAHVEVGGVLDEATIVEAMVANEAVLETRQGGERIWRYYKGANGLLEHGNIELA